MRIMQLAMIVIGHLVNTMTSMMIEYWHHQVLMKISCSIKRERERQGQMCMTLELIMPPLSPS